MPLVIRILLDSGQRSRLMVKIVNGEWVLER